MEHKSNEQKAKYIKRRSEVHKTNKIKNELFSLAQNEINEKKKIANEPFSFSSQTVYGENKIKFEPNLVLKHKNIIEKKISNDSSCDISDLENSSDLSCDAENI